MPVGWGGLRNQSGDLLYRLQPLFKVRCQTTFDHSCPLLTVRYILQQAAVPDAILAALLIFRQIIVTFQCAERQLSCQKLEHEHTEREDIRCGQYRRTTSGPCHLFRRHIGIGAEDLVGFAEDVALCHTVRTVSGDSEISQGSLAVLLEQDILGLEVTVYLSSIV